MSDINLTASMRSNLLSLQNTQELMDMTSERLSTGLKVNSAIDNPASYYTAASLDNRANDLTALMDSMGQGISTLKATDEAIMSITNFVEQAEAIAMVTAEMPADHPDIVENLGMAMGTYGTAAADGTWTMDVESDGVVQTINVDVTTGMTQADFDEALTSALNLEFGKGTFEVTAGSVGLVDSNNNRAYTFSNIDADGTGIGYAVPTDGTENVNNFIPASTEREDSYARFAEIMSQINMMARDASYKGVNLLDGSDTTLTINFNEDRSSRLLIDGVDARVSGLGLDDITVDNFLDNNALNEAMVQIDDATKTLRGYASDFGNYYAIVENREDFTDNLVNVLTEGSDKLILADMNEESANMLALQTRQELATNSLSLSSQAAQSVLRLFG